MSVGSARLCLGQHYARSAVAAGGSWLCEPCRSALGAFLRRAPGLIAHIAGLVRPPIVPAELGGIRAPRGSRSREPLNLGALADIDEGFATLSWWAGFYADRFGKKRPLLPPRTPRDPETGDVVGLPAGCGYNRAGAAVAFQTRLLLDNLGRIAGEVRTQDDAQKLAGFVAAVCDLVARLAGKWDRADPPYYSTLAHRCGGRVAVYPPSRRGEGELIRCELCGEVERDWERELVAAGAAVVTERGNIAAGILKHMARRLGIATA